MQESSAGFKNVEDTIKAEAFRLGFSLCGITTPGPPEQFTRYEHWLENRFNADMVYLASKYHVASRQDPQKLMPSAKSVICLAYPYSLHPLKALFNKDTSLVAGYAAGIDYHFAIPDRLTRLISKIESLLSRNIEVKFFTDSAPILERELSNRAGLGWIGKNSCLINPIQGSAFLLAEVFTDLPLNPDDPFKADRCGRCNRCVNSCPTKAILPDRSIDSRRCLSYHSIENKQEIPTGIAEKLPPWLFGCDICQMVCPWNKQPKMDSYAVSFNASELTDLLNLTPEEFGNRFGNSAIQRAKYFGFMRNVIINISSFNAEISLPVLDEFIARNSDLGLTKLAQSVIEKIKKQPPL